MFTLLLAMLAMSTTLPRPVIGQGKSCTSPIGPGTAAPNAPFWMETIKHQGTSAFNANPAAYQVFRNVKDFGAKGDGVADDTAAIKYVVFPSLTFTLLTTT